jgi:beta-xylosidase
MSFENQRSADLGDSTYRNPIFGGDFPDPSICRVDDVYYLTHSSFVYRPGLLVWSSRDLINWQPVAHALNHPGWSVWAPEIVHHKGRFYIYYFAHTIEGDWQGDNWVVWADDPRGPWSEPIGLGCGHIDPGHIVGDDGKRYLHLSGGHVAELHESGLKLVSEPKKVYDGWQIPEDWRIEGTALEGPKLFKREGWFYLVSAMGGTAGPATSHMVVAARSKSPLGPWENCPHNPILRTTSRADRWYSRGHGTPFEGPDGRWWIILHGYERGFHTLGRQTLLEPIRWTDDGWFEAVEGHDPAGVIEAPVSVSPVSPEASHYMPLSDDFAGKQLGMQWQKFGDFGEDRIEIGRGWLELLCSGSSKEPSAPLTCTPVDLAYEVEVELDRSRMEPGDAAGLVLYYDPRCFAGILAGPEGLRVARHGQLSGQAGKDLQDGPVRLKLVNDCNEMDIFYSQGGGAWKKHDTSLDVSGYHHNVFGKFLSLRPGILAVGKGRAKLRDFRYRGLRPSNDLPDFQQSVQE